MRVAGRDVQRGKRSDRWPQDWWWVFADLGGGGWCLARVEACQLGSAAWRPWRGRPRQQEVKHRGACPRECLRLCSTIRAQLRWTAPRRDVPSDRFPHVLSALPTAHPAPLPSVSSPDPLPPPPRLTFPCGGGSPLGPHWLGQSTRPSLQLNIHQLSRGISVGTERQFMFLREGKE